VKYLIPSAVGLLMISVGMSLSLAQLSATLRRLTLMAWVRMLAATFIGPAFLALLLARIFHLTDGALAGIFLIGVAPGAPLLTRNLSRRGFDLHLAATYQVWAAMMIPIMIPLVVVCAGKLYNRDIWISPVELFGQIAIKQLLPLALGMLFSKFAPSLATKVQPPLNIIGNIVLTVVLLLGLIKLGPSLKNINPLLPVVCLLLAVGCMSMVWLIGIREPIVKHTFAISNANRHVGLAVLLSGEYFHSTRALPPIACYALLVPFVMIGFATWYKRRRSTGGGTLLDAQVPVGSD
jgi:predicted Na+-dependent transporter